MTEWQIALCITLPSMATIGLCVLLASYSYAAGIGHGRAQAVTDEQKKAIRAGVGQWVADPETGEVSFVYGEDRR